MPDLNSEGRKANDAQPLGEQRGIETERARAKTAERERSSAGPDAADATDITSKQDGLLGEQGDPAEGERR